MRHMRGFVGFVALGLCSIQMAAADELAKLDGSVKLIPADAAFYSTMLRNREQVEIIAKSRAWAKLKSMPGVQMGMMALQMQLNNPQVAPFKKLYEQPENQQLVKVLGDMVSQEIFFYGGENVSGFVELIGGVSNAARFGPLAQLGSGGAQNATKAQVRAVLGFLADHQNLIRFPDLIVGFKLTKTEPAETQLKRLETLLNGVSQQMPLLQGRFKREKVAGSDFLTLKLDGSMIPWDKIPVQDWEEKEGEFDFLVKKLKELKLTVSLGIRDGYMLLAFGESTSAIGKLGAGASLAGRPEMKVLERHAKERLVAISYASQVFRSKTGTSKKDLARMAEYVTAALKNVDLTTEQRAKIRNDMADLVKDIEPYFPVIGASASCSFLTGQGYEGYSYDWTEGSPLDSSKPLSILDHMGGSPLLAIATRGRRAAEGSPTTEKWIKKVPGYLDEFLVPKLDAEQKEKYQQIAKIALPILERLGKTTTTMLSPALADGQFGFVLDAKVASKQWHKDLPPSDKPLPMLEPALVFGVSDASLLKRAFRDYRSIVNDAIAKLHELEPDKIPDFQIPEPESQKLKLGTSYFYPLPEIGLDKQLRPNAAVADDVAVIAVTQSHAERLLAKTPLKIESGPLADLKKPMEVAVYCHCEGIVKTIAPWVEYGVQAAMHSRGGDDEASVKQQTEMILSHARIVLEVLQVFRTYSSSTYLEDKMTVTHSQTVIRDL